VRIAGFTYGSSVTYSASFPDQTPYCYDNQADFCGNDQYMQLTTMSSGTYHPAFGGAGSIQFKALHANSHYYLGSGIGRSTDIDADGDTDEADENSMRTAIANPPGDSKYDLDFMGGATTADLQILLEEANRRWPGTNDRYLRGSCKMTPEGGPPPCDQGQAEANYYLGDYNPADLYQVPPATPSVSASGTCTTIMVGWADTGDDGTTGQAMAYEVRRSTSPITTEPAWSSATVVTVGTPGPNGTWESVYDDVGSCSATFYYAVRLMDDQLNWSGIGSTITAVQTSCTPASIDNLTAVTGRWDAVVNWNSPAHSAGCPATTEIRVHTSIITEQTWANAAVVGTLPAETQGTPMCFEIDGLNSCTTYYFAAKTSSGAGTSSISNVPRVKTKCSGAAGTNCMGQQDAVSQAPEEFQLTLGLVNASPIAEEAVLRFTIPTALEGARCDLTVYDIAGRRIATAFSGAAVAGPTTVRWVPNETGKRSSGVLFARLRVGQETRTIPLVLAH